MKRQSNSEIEQTRRFARILNEMTPRQRVFLRDYMEDLEAGRSTANSEAKLRVSMQERIR